MRVAGAAVVVCAALTLAACGSEAADVADAPTDSTTTDTRETEPVAETALDTQTDIETETSVVTDAGTEAEADADADDGETSECGVVDFESKVQPIFSTSCAVAGCHVGPTPPAELVLADGFAYSYLVNVTSAENPPMKRVAPKDLCNSYLVLKLGLMPSCAGSSTPGSHPPGPLTAAEKDAIVCWILDL